MTCAMRIVCERPHSFGFFLSITNHCNEADTTRARSIREARSSCPAARVLAEGRLTGRVAGFAPPEPASGLRDSPPRQKDQRVRAMSHGWATTTAEAIPA